MQKRITANLGLKIFSLLIALLLWFYVMTERVYEKTLIIPLSFVNLSENLSFAEQPPKSVKVRIRGKGKELIRLKFGEYPKIVSDFSKVRKGWKRVDLKKKDVNIPYWSKIEVLSDPNPKSFVVRIEKKQEL
ncbi:hypothetical protein KAW65_05260 [candidate division WOR-3 bacterium]|nr:hypothetical protein [candidate division WOR-3 bacterium]